MRAQMSHAPTFLCDDMLAGLARWLWAAGYDAAYEPEVSDSALVNRAMREGRVLLTSDRGMIERRVVRQGKLRLFQLPVGLSNEQALTLVLREFRLELGEPRCMKCGGELRVIPNKEDARKEAPPRTYEGYDQFFRCAGCAKLFWRGTHWRRILETLERAKNQPPPPSPPAHSNA